MAWLRRWVLCLLFPVSRLTTRVARAARSLRFASAEVYAPLTRFLFVSRTRLCAWPGGQRAVSTAALLIRGLRALLVAVFARAIGKVCGRQLAALPLGSIQLGVLNENGMACCVDEKLEHCLAFLGGMRSGMCHVVM